MLARDTRSLLDALSHDLLGTPVTGQSVLDVGGGPGYFADAFSDCFYVGLEPDISEMSAAGISGFGSVRGDGTALPFADDSFDVVSVGVGRVVDTRKCTGTSRRTASAKRSSPSPRARAANGPRQPASSRPHSRATTRRGRGGSPACRCSASSLCPTSSSSCARVSTGLISLDPSTAKASYKFPRHTDENSERPAKRQALSFINNRSCLKFSSSDVTALLPRYTSAYFVAAWTRSSSLASWSKISWGTREPRPSR